MTWLCTVYYKELVSHNQINYQKLTNHNSQLPRLEFSTREEGNSAIINTDIKTHSFPIARMHSVSNIVPLLSNDV